MLLIQAQTEDLVSVRALKNFAGKINRQGKTTCDYIHMIGTKHEIYESRGKILEKYWGYIFTFLDDTENDIDHRSVFLLQVYHIFNNRIGSFYSLSFFIIVKL